MRYWAFGTIFGFPWREKGLGQFRLWDEHDKRLMTLGVLTERSFRDDPSTAIFKLRQFAELTARTIAAHRAFYRNERGAFEEIRAGFPTRGSSPRR